MCKKVHVFFTSIMFVCAVITGFAGCANGNSDATQSGSKSETTGQQQTPQQESGQQQSQEIDTSKFKLIDYSTSKTINEISAVAHYKQTLDGKSYEFDDKNIKNAPAGTLLNELMNYYSGFYAAYYLEEEQTDGSYILNIYYVRTFIKVIFNANGGTIGENESVQFLRKYGSVFQKEDISSVTNSGKTFISWNTESDGSGTDYYNLDEFICEKEITLYAQWLENDVIEVTVPELAPKIKSLKSGNYTIKVSGSITDEDMADLKKALLENRKRFINLDLSKTTSLTKLGKEAFTIKETYYEGAPLRSLILPDTVTEIGENCFYNCKKMTKIYAPGVTKLNRCALYVCESLSDITIADELTEIDDLAFGFCRALKEITLNAKTIGWRVFVYNDNLTKVVIGPAVETISDEGFLQNSELVKTIVVSEGNNNFKVVDGLLYSADGTRLVRCPPALDITEITLSDSVISIDAYAFEECKKLTKTSLPNVEIIPSEAFMNANALTEVSIPKATLIDGLAFYHCESLKSIIMPDTLTKIGMFAFSNTTSLTSLYIPESVTVIESDVFNDWTEKQTINCEASEKPKDWEDDWSRYSSIDKEPRVTINWGVSRF